MQLQYAKSNVDNTGSLEHRRATIELNPTIAHVLSRDLYQRPIESMFREILINALDAHTEAGQTRPVSIHIPTIWDELFSVRDYGNGIEHSKLMDIYLAYGDSTRRGTDDVHGGLGLGTKSPLAYTSSFAVTSYVDGVKNEYLIYYDEDNLPCVDHRETSTTDEPNGLKVSLTTVSSNDYDAFHRAATILLPRIPDGKVEIENNAVADIEVNRDITEQIGNIKLKSGSGIFVSMGYVAYEMDSKAVLNHVTSKGIKFTVDGVEYPAQNILSILLRTKQIEIVSSIGKYPVHPSREYINISPRAVKCLCDDIQEGLNILFKDTKTLNIEQDIFRYLILGSLPVWKEEIKIRGRLLTGESWQGSIRMPKQLNTYAEFISALSVIRHTVHACGLPGVQLTDFLGNGRSEFTFPQYWKRGVDALFVYENDDPLGQFETLVSETYIPYDLTAVIAKYFADKEIEARYREQQQSSYVYTPRQRRVVKSMQDPKHNVLTLDSKATGAHKIDWSSTKHNVQSLKDLGTNIFWVPTHQGCLKDSVAREIIQHYYAYKGILPKKWKAIILGLPASKGTKAIESAFEPIAKLRDHVDAFLATDTYKRKQIIKSVQNFIISDFNVSELDDYAAYGPVNWFIRLNKQAHSIDSVSILGVSDLKNKPLYEKARVLKEELTVKFPHLFSTKYYYYQPLAKSPDIRQWIETLADLLNNKPTGAKAKNDPYYLSRR